MPEQINDIAFCLNNLDRDGVLRGNDTKLNQIANSPNARIYPFSGFNALIDIGENTRKGIYFNGDELAKFENRVEQLIYLGVDGDVPYFGAAISGDADNIINIINRGGEFIDLRANMNRLEPTEISIMGTARSLIAWHSTHSFCSNCGSKSVVKYGGWKRVCKNCNTEHFPRVDPVAIMLVLYGDKCLLGRSVNFPEGLYSTLAGFIEPGETFEQGCKREVLEEVGIEVDNIQIIGNQPWPFPSQLMIGMVAYAKNEIINLDTDEVLDAKWFTKDEVVQLISKNGIIINGKECYGPRRAAIAFHLLQYWLDN